MLMMFTDTHTHTHDKDVDMLTIRACEPDGNLLSISIYPISTLYLDNDYQVHRSLWTKTK